MFWRLFNRRLVVELSTSVVPSRLDSYEENGWKFERNLSILERFLKNDKLNSVEKSPGVSSPSKSTLYELDVLLLCILSSFRSNKSIWYTCSLFDAWMASEKIKDMSPFFNAFHWHFLIATLNWIFPFRAILRKPCLESLYPLHHQKYSCMLMNAFRSNTVRKVKLD